MSTFMQLATMAIDMTNVLEIRDEDTEQVTLILGPADAIEVLVLQKSDAAILKKWLEADQKALLQRRLYGVDIGTILNRESPPTLESPPF